MKDIFLLVRRSRGIFSDVLARDLMLDDAKGTGSGRHGLCNKYEIESIKKRRCRGRGSLREVAGQLRELMLVCGESAEVRGWTEDLGLELNCRYGMATGVLGPRCQSGDF